MEQFVGRQNELQELERAAKSSRSEFIVVYGRRRVGKTYLVRRYFGDKYAFHYVGAHRKSNNQQLANFSKALLRFRGPIKGEVIATWADAFEALQNYLASRKDLKRKVIFIDEMPWIDNKQSGFVDALEFFWNSWVMGRDDIILVACGSATSWMVDKLIENQGGLRGRITRRIYLHPFTLHETKEYLSFRGFDWDDYQILQSYMVMGGIPYYLSMLEPELSLPQNIDALFFNRSGLLRDEFNELYNALFSKADSYIAVVKALYTHRDGLTRKEIEAKTGYSGGTLTKILSNLERCDFILGFNYIGNKTKNTIYRLIDFYTVFYLKFIENDRTMDEQFWMHNFQSRSVEVWEGLSFELVCLQHIYQIKHALGISGISTEVSSWRSFQKDSGPKSSKNTQIDLVIKRVDKMVHLCEIKFSSSEYLISALYEQTLRKRQEIFSQQTGITRGVVHTFITPYGVKQGKHYGIIHSQVTANELFAL